MLTYKFGTMDMDWCRDSTSSVSESFIQGLGFSMAPTDMTMDYIIESCNNITGGTASTLLVTVCMPTLEQIKASKGIMDQS